ncbi:LOW QUALITY PROTEIN: putative protein MSS51 homolog, mitochondrial [Panulirus ornatus]|uniref:LOW QUALITY PROTEIN: putative protein MSS51 homolog, mitochondrial n=1 Tax=Panulirus ornatus TaxID=150431 RepID=UPI003A8A4AB9
MAFELSEYPPKTFSDKYQKYLAPHGVLLSPQQVLKNKKLGNNVEETLRKAFKITVKKLRKMRSACANCNATDGVSVECEGCGAARYCSQECRAQRQPTHALVCHSLRNELLDQVVECLPSPVSLGREVLQGRGGKVSHWDDWFTRHTVLRERIAPAASLVAQWWSYTGLPNPGEASLRASLERIVSNVFSTVLTIGHCIYWFPALQPAFNDVKELHIHLLGADQPEVGAVESGLIQVASRVVGRPLVVTLVAPDLTHHPQTFSWTPTHPQQVTPAVRAVAYPGLYHDFWREHVATTDPEAQVRRPDVALAIHPGVHTTEMLALWKPTLLLLAYERIPVAMTTFNQAEFQESLEKLEVLKPNIVYQDVNPLGSLHAKQTPYEPDHVWAANAYVIAIDNITSRTT